MAKKLVGEKFAARKYTETSREFSYVLTGYADEEEAYKAVPGDDKIPVTVNRNGEEKKIKLKKDVSIEEVYCGENSDQNIYYAIVRYEPDEEVEEEEELNYSISITTNTANVKVALDQTKKVASGEKDPGDFGNWIGVVRNGAGFDIQGVDVIFPQATLEIERQYEPKEWNSKVKQIIRKVGMCNSGSFESFGEEEVLFSGAKITRTKTLVTANYQFLISQTEDVEIPGVGTITKKGWRYIWVFSRVNEVDGIGTKPVAVYVARVYKRTNFNSIL